MIAAPPHEHEDERLRALVELHLLDSPPEDAFDSCVHLAAAICGTAKAAVSLIDRERQWFKAIFGDLPPETTREVSFCAHAVAHDDVLIVPDATKDPRFATNPLVKAGLRFYAGVLLHGGDGYPIGTLCVLNDEPIALSGEQLAGLRGLADALQKHLDLRLLTLKLSARLAEQVGPTPRRTPKPPSAAASLAHDIKNPLAVVAAGAAYLSSLEGLPPEVAEVAKDMLESTQAAEHLLLDMLDATRMDAGALQAQFAQVDLSALAARALRHARLLAAEREQPLVFEDRSSSPFAEGDRLLIERTVRNLVDNALKYAPRGRPITLTLRDGPGDSVDLRVEDEGATIPADDRERIFEPYVQRESADGPPGQGIGLAFCRSAVAMHAGRVWVEPRPAGGNAFVVRIPRQQPAVR